MSRVLVVHNRYRVHGGEERAVELQLAALERAGIAHGSLLRDSGEAGRAAAASAMLRGGEQPRRVREAVHELGATVVHAHNMQPLLGPRALAAAREAGARVVLNLHNFRLFCAIGVAFRDGESCFRCRGRLTLPGLALNCRDSLPEAAVYAAALSAHQPAVLDAVDRFVTPSRFAAGQLARLGLPAERIETIPNYLPEESFAERSRADRGRFALVAGRLSPEKGAETAIEAALRAGVPLKVAGDGPLEEELRAGLARDARVTRAGGGAGRARRAGEGAGHARGGAPLPAVELLGRVDRPTVRALLAEAAVVLLPSVGVDVFPFAALEAMAAGVPVIAARTGGLPEMVGEERCVPRRDPDAMAHALAELWGDPERRRAEGDELIARARERFGEQRYVDDLRRLYASIGG